LRHGLVRSPKDLASVKSSVQILINSVFSSSVCYGEQPRQPARSSVRLALTRMSWSFYEQWFAMETLDHLIFIQPALSSSYHAVTRIILVPLPKTTLENTKSSTFASMPLGFILMV